MLDGQKDKFVIGIDFGVEFTGACYSFISDSDAKPTIIPIVRWPNAGKSLYHKTPTVSVYKKTNDEYNLSRWGQKAQSSKPRPDSIRLSRFNLLIDSKLGTEHEFDGGLPLKKVIADYLEKVVHYVKTDIDSKYPQFKKHPNSFRYCLTLPVTCTDTAKSNIRQAAVDAGLITSNDPHKKLGIIEDSEAIAIACEFDKTETLNSGDVIFVCNASDNAFNLIAYKVYYKEGKKYFEELARVQSKSCGCTCINKLARLWFKAHLENALGMSSIKSGELDEMTLTFSTQQKVNFGDNENDEDDGDDDDDDDDDDNDDNVLLVSLPNSLARRIDEENELPFLLDNKFIITSAEAKEFLFDPVVNEILKLISGQLDRIPDIQPEKIKLFLGGGFGQSKYLYKKITEKFVNTCRIGLLFVPKEGGLSIARGAVLYSLDPVDITHCVSRRSYGVRCNRSYREGIDRPKYLVIGRDGKKRCKNRIDFLIKKGTPIAKNHYTEREYYALYPDNLKFTLYAYDADGELPDYITDEGIEAVSKLDIIMPEIPGKRPNEKIKYKTKIYFGLTEIKIKVEICGQTQTYLLSLDENDANSSQAMTGKELKLPGFDSMINHFKRLGYQTDHYRNYFQIPSPEVKVERRHIGTIKKQYTPVVVSGGQSQALPDDSLLSNDSPSLYFDANPNAQMLPELP